MFAKYVCQVWWISIADEIRRDDLCLDWAGEAAGPVLRACHGLAGNQAWQYNRHSRQVKQAGGGCLTARGEGELTVAECDAKRTGQRWKLKRNK